MLVIDQIEIFMQLFMQRYFSNFHAKYIPNFPTLFCCWNSGKIKCATCTLYLGLWKIVRVAHTFFGWAPPPNWELLDPSLNPTAPTSIEK